MGNTQPAVFSADRATALLSTPIEVEDGGSEDADLLVDTTDHIKALHADAPSGLQAKVSGPAGFSADAIDVFADVNGTLLYATAAFVLLLLIGIYRSLVFWTIPFLTVLHPSILGREGPRRRGWRPRRARQPPR